jgi:DNA primase
MGTIPTENIEQIAAANDIVEVIGSYFPLKRAGSSYKALCPFHQEKTPSFTVSPQRQSFHCFGCGAGGSVFRFVMDYEHLDFPSAVKKLGARAGIPVIEERGSGGDEDRQHESRRTLLQLHSEAAEWFHENLLKREWARPAREYLKKRGIDRGIVGNWQIGFAPESWDAFLNWAKDRGYRRPEVAQSGLVKPRDEERPDGEVYDRFRGRIMFPICNDVGEVIAFSGRVLRDEEGTAKYLNSPETPLFRKGHVLFGLHKTKRPLIEANQAIVCEGQLDLITLFEAGIANVVAPQGTAFTENQARILRRFVGEVVLCFDADAAGQKAAERSLESLLQNDLIVRIAEMPAGEDPDSILRRQGKAEFEKRINNARDFFDYWIEREAAATDLNSIGERTQLARRLAEIITRVPNSVIRAAAVNRASARLGLTPRDMEFLITKPNVAIHRTASVTDVFGQKIAPPSTDAVSILSRYALRDPDVFEFLKMQNWREVLSRTANTEMLIRMLESELRPDNPESVSAFMARLDADEEALVSSWLREQFKDNGGVVQSVAPNSFKVAVDCWREIQEAAIRRQMQIVEGRMKIPRLSAGELTNLQKEVVDLKRQLDEFSALSSARVLDN